VKYRRLIHVDGEEAVPLRGFFTDGDGGGKAEWLSGLS
jgi:hypothetical protein